MSDNVKKGAEGTAAAKTDGATTKVARRGVGSARGTTRLKFDHSHAMQNGLFLGHLESVEVKEITIGEDTSGMPSFNGLTIPRLLLTFASNDENVNKRKYVHLQFNAVESNAETIPGGKADWKVNQIFDYIKHILNVYYLKGRDMTEEEEMALSLEFTDFDEEGQYVPVEPELVIAAWKSLFENFTSIMQTGRESAPVYKTKDGKFISIWMKLIRYFKDRKNTWKAANNGDLGFPSFVGEGAIEIFKANTPASIRIDVIREDIKPREIETPKTPNMPGAGIGGGPGFGGGININQGIIDPIAAPSGIAMEAGNDDLPF